VAFATGCGGGGDADGQSVDVTFARTDGSLATFPETVRAWCGPYDDESPDTEAVHVLAGTLPRSESPDAYWIVNAVPADVERDHVTTLPNSFVSPEPQGAALFAYDVEDRENELSSADEESRGTIRVELAGCEPGETVRVEFDKVTLGSEYSDLPTISVEGAVTAESGDAPASS
jgi:hypothetical protein